MNFFQAIASFFRNYAVFKGRSSRSEFWWVVLFGILMGGGLGELDSILFDNPEGPLVTVFFFGTFIPLLALTARRLHDVNRSGWWMLLAGIPWLTVPFFMFDLYSSALWWLLFVLIIISAFVGAFLLLYWHCKKGDIDDNRFGSNPLSKSVDTAAS